MLGFLINSGAFAEWNLMRSAVNARKTVTLRVADPRGNKPHPLSGHRPYCQYRAAFTVIFFIATAVFMLYEWGILGLFLLLVHPEARLPWPRGGSSRGWSPSPATRELERARISDRARGQLS